MLAYYFRDSKCFALFNLETRNFLAFSFREPNVFALYF